MGSLKLNVRSSLGLRMLLVLALLYCYTESHITHSLR